MHRSVTVVSRKFVRAGPVRQMTVLGLGTADDGVGSWDGGFGHIRASREPRGLGLIPLLRHGVGQMMAVSFCLGDAFGGHAAPSWRSLTPEYFIMKHSSFRRSRPFLSHVAEVGAYDPLPSCIRRA